MAKVSIKKGRQFQLLRGHPWLFSGGISQAPGKVEPGEIVDLVDIDGKFVARGYYNPACDIAVRILTTNPDEQIDRQFVARRVRQAVELRALAVDSQQTNAYRLINAEGDFLPGIIADKFADVIVLQSHTAGGDRLIPDVIDTLVAELKPQAIILRNDAAVRKRECLTQMPPQVVHGQWSAGTVEIIENSFKFKVDPQSGQKTGFFTDQRDKRAAVMNYCRHLPPNTVLANCFCYSGSFSIYAAAGNKLLRSINIDQSDKALELARESFALNGLEPDNHQFVQADVFAWLEEQIAANATYPFVILDPPAFAKSHKDHQTALKAYTGLNSLGLRVCAPGALLMTCSCSGIVSLQEFEECLQTAAARVSRSVQVLQTFKHGTDHPVSIAAPETQYLKVLLCRVL